ncbi:MAG TPA: BamA/TamA family outer membrane protein [Sphingorhabdus sp.]|nr:BamA/TamA family outer membrane protein [Sphingorhabdus sp.]
MLFLLGAMLSAAPAVAQNPLPPPPTAAQQSTQQGDARPPIIPDDEFNEAIPSLDAPPMESIDDWQKAEDAKEQAEQAAKDPPIRAAQDGDAVEILPDPPVTDPLLDDPLPPIETFDAEPPPNPTEAADDEARGVRYTFRIDGLDPDKATGTNPEDAKKNAEAWRDVRGRFNDLSALDDGDGRADNRAEVGQRARNDRQLLLDILNGQGFFDADVRVSAEAPVPAAEGTPATPFTVVLSVVPGRRYYLGQILFEAPPVLPADLITKNFVPKTGDAIVADTILAAEANISVVLPQQGYPFAKVGQRDILLDSDVGTGDYTLPVATGARSSFGQVRNEGDNPAFDAEHVALLRRFKTGDLYDSRLVDDLRAALVATGLLSTVSVEPVAGEGTAPDGTAYADLLVRQEAGPPRTLAASAGYGTGQGFRAEASWTHRNLFPPEGSLALAGVLGTQEQAASITFARANAGKRDRNLEVSLSALHSTYDAFDAYTGRLAAVMSYVSTPIWQKKFTWSAGVELLATYEGEYDLARGVRDRRIYYVGALPGQVGFDRSDDLLNPTKGFRLNLRLSPEASLGSGTRFYARAILDGSYYFPATDSLVLAARARVGTISGAARGDIAPSRRFYGGGGGSVRGFGYQQLGPKDPNGDPIGGRSTNEAAVEARYRFGNFGVVGFVDAGQVYESSFPQFDDWRFGVGIGGRFYTNFGPLRLDVATPINRKSGESRVTVYVSIGQAF